MVQRDYYDYCSRMRSKGREQGRGRNEKRCVLPHSIATHAMMQVSLNEWNYEWMDVVIIRKKRCGMEQAGDISSFRFLFMWFLNRNPIRSPVLMSLEAVFRSIHAHKPQSDLTRAAAATHVLLMIISGSRAKVAQDIRRDANIKEGEMSPFQPEQWISCQIYFHWTKSWVRWCEGRHFERRYHHIIPNVDDDVMF